MNAPTQIDVTSSQGVYPVLVGPGLIARTRALLRDHGLDDECAVVSCAPVWRRHGGRLRAVRGAGGAILIPDGERGKTLKSVEWIYGALLKRRLDRSATLVAFGGGVVGDVAGFAAATYLRGISLVQIPTTLLAQVDSAVGGKVGVNLPAGKNLVGAFHPPRLVICDPTVLASLPLREFRAGLYEVVKYGIIRSRTLFNRIANQLTDVLSQDPDVLSRVISDCCAIKAAVVGEDEREGGLRRILNFGHTIGHALEAITGYRRFRHGEAVAYGMLAAARLSVMRGTLSQDDETRIRALIGAVGPLPRTSDLRTTDALGAIRHDKKVVKGRLHFVLASGIGATEIVSDVQTRDLSAALRSIGLCAT